MWKGSLSLVLLLQGAITLVDSVAVMSVDLGAEWMKIAVVTVSTIRSRVKMGNEPMDLRRLYT